MRLRRNKDDVICDGCACLTGSVNRHPVTGSGCYCPDCYSEARESYTDAPPDRAEAAHCEQCEGIGESFHKGTAAIQNHAQSFPLHTRITYLRMEAL